MIPKAVFAACRYPATVVLLIVACYSPVNTIFQQNLLRCNTTTNCPGPRSEYFCFKGECAMCAVVCTCNAEKHNSYFCHKECPLFVPPKGKQPDGNNSVTLGDNIGPLATPTLTSFDSTSERTVQPISNFATDYVTVLLLTAILAIVLVICCLIIGYVVNKRISKYQQDKKNTLSDDTDSLTRVDETVPHRIIEIKSDIENEGLPLGENDPLNESRNTYGQDAHPMSKHVPTRTARFIDMRKRSPEYAPVSVHRRISDQEETHYLENELGNSSIHKRKQLSLRNKFKSENGLLDQGANHNENESSLEDSHVAESSTETKDGNGYKRDDDHERECRVPVQAEDRPLAHPASFDPESSHTFSSIQTHHNSPAGNRFSAAPKGVNHSNNIIVHRNITPSIPMSSPTTPASFAHNDNRRNPNAVEYRRRNTRSHPDYTSASSPSQTIPLGIHSRTQSMTPTSNSNEYQPGRGTHCSEDSTMLKIVETCV